MRSPKIVVGMGIFCALAAGGLFLHHCSDTKKGFGYPILLKGVKSSYEAKRAFEAAFSAKIEFYGTVVDQFGVPIDGATVELSVANKGEAGTTALKTISNAAGEFSVHSKGALLYVTVRKSGYHRINFDDPKGRISEGSFAYGFNAGKGIHKPVEDSPVIFTLFKAGGR